MSKEDSKPKSRREHDQMKRDKMSNKNSVSGNKPVSSNKPVLSNESIIGKCKKLLRRENSES
jgi:hypothetical protein